MLYEAQERDCVAHGAEVNPAAWHLAALASYGGLPQSERGYILARLMSVAAMSATSEGDMFSSSSRSTDILELMRDEEHPFMRKALASVVLLGMGDKPDLAHPEIARGAFSVISLLKEMRSANRHAECYLSDARRLPILDSVVDAVITSPPYINVFNYHQNYRPAAELLGWNPLEAARSEVGSNRKHRMNRFLTVIQYCMDMAQAILEMHRVLKDGAPLVIVVGRTSSVLGTPFLNSSFIGSLLAFSGSEVKTAERVFTNRYGEHIYEDVLTINNPAQFTIDLDDAGAIGVAGLKAALNTVPENNRSTLLEAISRANEVECSPFLRINVPSIFAPASPPSARVVSNAG